MSNKALYAIIAALVAVIIGGGIYFYLTQRGGRTTTTAGTPQTAPPAMPSGPAGEVSEKPNQAKYSEYLTEIYLGAMPIGKKIGVDGFPTKTGVFISGQDQFCTMMTLTKSVPSGQIATVIYDVTAQVNQPRQIFPVELKAGGSGGCGTLTQSAGKYEYKLYIDGELVAVLPFEVR